MWIVVPVHSSLPAIPKLAYQRPRWSSGCTFGCWCEVSAVRFPTPVGQAHLRFYSQASTLAGKQCRLCTVQSQHTDRTCSAVDTRGLVLRLQTWRLITNGRAEAQLKKTREGASATDSQTCRPLRDVSTRGRYIRNNDKTNTIYEINNFQSDFGNGKLDVKFSNDLELKILEVYCSPACDDVQKRTQWTIG